MLGRKIQRMHICNAVVMTLHRSVHFKQEGFSGDCSSVHYVTVLGHPSCSCFGFLF